MILETLKLDVTEKSCHRISKFSCVFFGTDQILVRQRYGYKLRGSSLENLYGQWSGCDQGYIVYLTTHLLPGNNNLLLHD